MSKIPDSEHMETGDIEGPTSGQITPGEASVISDMCTVDMSMEEINLRNVLLEPKNSKLDNLDEIYSMLDHYCELQRIRKNIPDGDLQENDFKPRECWSVPNNKSFDGAEKTEGIRMRKT